MTDPRFPNETPDYRQARNALLAAELELRAKVEEVAALRRELPSGGALAEDYVFQEMAGGKVRDTRFSELFADGRDTLFLYHFMYSPSMDTACPMCVAMLDGLNAQMKHIGQNISTAVVAKHDIETLESFAHSRRWDGMRLLSSANNTFNRDYFGELEGRQMPFAHVFRRDGDGTIRHFWSSEMAFSDNVEGGNTRHLDMIWPLWNVLDLTPNGRGQWYPALEYRA